MLRALQVEKDVFVQNGTLTHIFMLSGELCSTDALWLKNTLLEFTYRENIVVDLSQLTRADLTAINALALGHKKHRLMVVLPTSPAASDIFHLTKFTSILTTIPAVPVYYNYGFFAQR